METRLRRALDSDIELIQKGLLGYTNIRVIRFHRRHTIVVLLMSYSVLSISPVFSSPKQENPSSLQGQIVDELVASAGAAHGSQTPTSLWILDEVKLIHYLTAPTSESESLDSIEDISSPFVFTN